MKEIKFRIWDTCFEKYVNYKLKYKNGKLYGIYRHPIVIEQYIGLKDKNGKEIHEGDIVEWWDKLGVVKYEKEFTTYNIYAIKNGKVTDSWFELSERMTPNTKIIDNVHDNNRKLLEKK